MSSEVFWALSFYEWSIWILRIRSQQEKRNQDVELAIELERTHMELLAIVNGLKKKDGMEVTKYDFFGKLSYDTVRDQEVKMSDAEKMEMVKQRFKKYIKHPKNG
jgi:hypothetical protein